MLTDFNIRLQHYVTPVIKRSDLIWYMIRDTDFASIWNQWYIAVNGTWCLKRANSLIDGHMSTKQSLRVGILDNFAWTPQLHYNTREVQTVWRLAQKYNIIYSKLRPIHTLRARHTVLTGTHFWTCLPPNSSDSVFQSATSKRSIQWQNNLTGHGRKWLWPKSMHNPCIYL